MKNIIWLSPSLAAGAIAAQVVSLLQRHPQIRHGLRQLAGSSPFLGDIAGVRRHIAWVSATSADQSRAS